LFTTLKFVAPVPVIFFKFIGIYINMQGYIWL
jgi:hypothetical protein